jgi:uncharacterized damage-inducible protein DinB
MSFDRLSMLLAMRDQSWNAEGGWCVNLESALKGTTAVQSVWKPPSGGNSIRQLVNHLNFYNERLAYKLEETPNPPQANTNLDTFGENPEADEADWQDCLKRTEEVAARRRKTLGALTDEDLSRPFGEGTLLDYLIGWLPHDMFHTGQIVQLRRMQEAWTIQFD